MKPAFKDAPKQRYSLRQRLVLAIVPWLASWCYRGLYATCRLEIRMPDQLADLAASRGAILAGFWHENIALVACAHRGRNYCTITSQSFDGELAARMVRRFGSTSVRGSSSRGGVAALANLEKAFEESNGVVVTLDGPRGPRRRAKAGIAHVAGRTGHPIIPVACAADRVWRLRSWDRFIIPKPGARIIIEYGDPISPPEDATSEAARKTAKRVEMELNTLQEHLELELNADPQL